jgi:predicted RNase H-like HicB family nuclease
MCASQLIAAVLRTFSENRARIDPLGVHLRFKVEFEQEEDGRWIAEVPDLPGVLAYGADRAEAQARVQALALRVVAERLEHGEAGPELLDISFQAA